jgi:hypothetical protein
MGKDGELSSMACARVCSVIGVRKAAEKRIWGSLGTAHRLSDGPLIESPRRVL